MERTLLWARTKLVGRALQHPLLYQHPPAPAPQGVRKRSLHRHKGSTHLQSTSRPRSVHQQMICFLCSRTRSGFRRGRVRQPRYICGARELPVDMLTICRRAQLRQIQIMSYLEAVYVANTSHSHRARKSNRPGHCKARPGQRVKL